MEVEITTENFESYKNGELPLVVDLWATWCGPCKMIGPVISELANDYDGKIVVGKCNIEDNDDIAIDYGVRNIPTILFFKNGELVDSLWVLHLKTSSTKSSKLCFNVSRIIQMLLRHRTLTVWCLFLCAYFSVSTRVNSLVRPRPMLRILPLLSNFAVIRYAYELDKLS